MTKFHVVGLACVTVFLSATAAVIAQQAPPGAQAQQQREVKAFSDERIAIALTETERAFIRREMRGLLEAAQNILEASVTGDRTRVAAAGRNAGMNGPEKDHIPPSLAPKLPMEFKQLGLATHRGFDAIAQTAESGGVDAVPRRLGELMKNCLACHSTWRIAVEGGR